jgi:outer membrane protein, heavy metal efflux system
MPMQWKKFYMPIRDVFFHSVCFLVLGFAGGCATSQPKPLTPAAIDTALKPPQLEVLRIEAGTIKHPLLRPISFDQRDGISPDEAAILAVWANPALRSVRDERGVTAAQLLQAGLLPNPEFSGSLDKPVQAPAEVMGYSSGLSWDISALIRNAAARDVARAHAASVDLDIAWQEWQTAQAAKLGVYRRLGLESQLTAAHEVESSLMDNLARIRAAAEQGQQTALNVAAAEAAAQEGRAAVLELQRELDKETLSLNRVLGLPAEAKVMLQADIGLPPRLNRPTRDVFLQGLEDRRLDLAALKRGYDSQEAAVRAAVLDQFPKVNIGLSHNRDTGDFFFWSPAITFDLPVFDRNQAAIAQEKATRQKLFDEYVNRVFEARSELATLLGEVEAVERQIAATEAALPALEQLARAYQLAFDSGNADVLSLYTARNDLARKRIEAIKLKQELAELGVGLELAAGLYLQNEPGGPALSSDDYRSVSPREK